MNIINLEVNGLKAPVQHKRIGDKIKFFFGGFEFHSCDRMSQSFSATISIVQKKLEKIFSDTWELHMDGFDTCSYEIGDTNLTIVADNGDNEDLVIISKNGVNISKNLYHIKRAVNEGRLTR